MKRKIILIPLIVIIQLSFNIVTGAAWVTSFSEGLIPSGITVGGEKVGGLTREQAVLHLKNNSSNLIDQRITIKDGEKEWSLQTQDYNFRYDYNKSVNHIMTEMPLSKEPSEWLNTLKWQSKKRDIPLEVIWEQQKLTDFLNDMYQETFIPLQDAKIVYQNNRTMIKPEKKGQELDLKITAERIVENILTGKPDPVYVVKNSLLPQVVSQDLKEIDRNLGFFTTNLDNTTSNRSYNISLSAQYLDGTVVMPGEVFSFNNQVGPRTLENGFKRAPQIVGGRLTQGAGGGVCQMATTLYNAALRAGLEIVERSHHSSPVSYVPVGRDATVFDDQLDLKIKNNLFHPIALECNIENNALKVRVLGNSKDYKQVCIITRDFVKILPNVSTIKNPDLEEGTVRQSKKGRSGHGVKVYRVITGQDGQEFEELISDDYYQSVNAVIEMGTKKLEETIDK